MNLNKALKYSELRHKGQMYGNEPYINHLNEVVSLAKKLGYDEEIQVACALHDTLEDTSTTPQDLVINFGQDVFNIVWAVTDASGNNRSERKMNTYPKIKQNEKAVVVKVLDRICNINKCLENENNKKFNMYKDEHKDLFIHTKSESHSEIVKKAWQEYGKFFGLNLDISYKIYMQSLSN